MVDGEVQGGRGAADGADSFEALQFGELGRAAGGPVELDGVAAQGGGELRGRALGDDLAVVDEDDFIAVGFGLGGVVGADQEGAAVVAQVAEPAPDGFGGAGVEREGGFVEQQQGGLVEQGAGEVESSAEAAGEGGAEVVGALGELEFAEQLDNAPGALGAGQSEEARVQVERLAERHQVVGGGLLEEDADAAAGGRAGRLAEDAQSALLGIELAGDQAEDGALAGAVGAEQGDPAAGLDVEVDLGDAAAAGPVECRCAELCCWGHGLHSIISDWSCDSLRGGRGGVRVRDLRCALAQMNSTVGDLEGNAARIIAQIEAAEAVGADIVAFPELALTGYPPEDLVLRRGFVEDNLRTLDRVREATRGRHAAAIVGFVDYAHDVFNAAAVLRDGRLHGVYHKQYLPNYGVFDEARYFRPGGGVQLFEIAGAKVGVTICEDIWYSSGPMQDQCLAGAELIVNINGSPFHAGKSAQREQMLATRAADNAVATAYCNLVGGQDHLIFDGGSAVFGPGGQLLSRAELFEEQLLCVDIDIEEVRQVRLHDPRLRRLPQTEGRLIGVGAASEGARPALEQKVAEPKSAVAQVYEALVLGTRDYVHKTGFEKVIIALSGGIDSTITAVLAVEALGAEQVRGVAMPSRYSSEGSVSDARALAENLGIRLDILPIEDSMQAMLGTLGPVFEGLPADVTEENLQARIRGVLMMALSNKLGALVLTTSNKSESATGYTTLYGDMTGGLAVIQDVPKLLVYELSRYANERAGREVVPLTVIEKPPSAELRPDQFDEQSLMPYERLDPILQAFVEEDRSLEDIAAAGFAEEDVKRVMSLVTGAEYKRRQAAPGLRITPRAFGKDRRFPIANRYRGF